MGWFSSVCSAVGSFCSSVCSCVSSVCSAIGGAVASVCGAMAETILKLNPSTIDVVLKVIEAIITVCLGLGEDEKIEDYGAAMRQVDKKPEDFDSIKEYIEYLREEIKSGRVDLSSSENDIERYADKVLGASLMIKAIDEKYGLKTSAEFWGTMGEKFEKGKIDGNELDVILKKSGEEQIDVNNVARYLKHEELKGGDQKSEISTIIIDSLKESNPKMSENEINTRFNEALKDG